MVRATYGTSCVLGAAVLWGTTGTAAALAPGVGSLAVGAGAMGIGGLLQAGAALPVIYAHRERLAAVRSLVVLSAVAVTVFPLAFYTSMRMAGVAVGNVVSIGSAPVAAALIERVLDKQRFSRTWMLGAAAAVGGVLILGLARSGGTAQRAHLALGVFLGLVAGFTYAMYSWGAARIMRHQLPSRPVMGAVFGVGGVSLLPVLVVTGGPILHAHHGLVVVAYLAVVPMFLGYILFGAGLRAISASTATTLSLLEPVIATLLAVLVLRERLSVTGWAGIALLLASLAVIAADSRRHQLTPSLVSNPPPSEHPATPMVVVKQLPDLRA